MPPNPLDTIGGFRRSVRDAALLGAVLTGDERLGEGLDGGVPRIGLCRTPEWPQVDEDTVGAWHLASTLLADPTVPSRRNPTASHGFVGRPQHWHARARPMKHPSTHGMRIAIDANASVSALLCVPDGAWAGYVFAHGAGAGMAHGFMTDFADGLAERGIATLRYQFPYMEQGSKRPDVPKVAHAAVRAAVAKATQRMSGLPLFAGGKSFGGRMTSQAQALTPLHGVRGLVFVGFPLHPTGKPGDGKRPATAS